MVADRVIADFFAEIFELKGEELATEDAHSRYTCQTLA